MTAKTLPDALAIERTVAETSFLRSWEREMRAAGRDIAAHDFSLVASAFDRQASEITALRAEVEMLRAATVWRPIETAPEDETVLLATTGEWVGTARLMCDDDRGEAEWFWGEAEPVHPNHVPLGWMPLPSPPAEG